MPCSEKNSTQTELAEYLFLTPQTVSRWEVGSGAPEITLLPKGVHSDSDVEQPHMDAPDALLIAPEPIGVQNELEIRLVPLIPVLPGLFRFHPAVVSGPGHAGDIAQLGHCKDVAFFGQRRPDGAEPEAGALHRHRSEPGPPGCRISFLLVRSLGYSLLSGGIKCRWEAGHTAQPPNEFFGVTLEVSAAEPFPAIAAHKGPDTAFQLFGGVLGRPPSP